MKYHLIALFTIFVWGLTFVSTKVLLVDLAPLWILMLRFVVGFVALCVLRPHVLRLHERSHEWLFVAAGLTGITAYYLLENIALVYATATAVGVIVAVSPLFTAILQALTGDHAAMNARFLAGFALAMCGLVTVGAASEVALGGGDSGLQIDAMSLFGYLLALLAGLVWAIYSVLVKRIADLGYETIASTKRTFLWGLVFIVPATLLFGGGAPDFSRLLDPVSLSNLLFLGVIASAACFVTWGVVVKNLGATTSTTYIYLVPAITATASVLVLGEPLNAGIVVGLLLTIGGLALSQWTPEADAGDEVRRSAPRDTR